MPSEFSLLREIAKLIARNFPKRTNTITKSTKRDQQERMYDALIDPEVRDEAELRRRSGLAGSTEEVYAALRNRTKETLFNSLFLMELPPDANSEYHRARFESARTVFIAEALSMHGVGNAATRAIKKGIKLAQKYEFTVHEHRLLQILRLYASLEGSKEEVRKLVDVSRQNLGLLNAEAEVTVLFDKLSASLAVTGASSSELIAEATAATTRIRMLYKKYDTFNLGRSYFRMAVINEELQFAFGGALALCEAAKQFIRSHPQFDSPAFLADFAMRSLECALHIGDYATATKSVLECNLLYKKGNSNWFVFKWYEFILRMHLEKFAEARKVLEEVTIQSRLQTIPAHLDRRWRLGTYYLEFAEEKFSDADHAKRQLSVLQKLRKESPDYFKDKHGYNLSILLMEFLIVYQSGDYRLLQAKVESVRLYRVRNVPKDSVSKAFLAFLLIVVRTPINRTALKLAASAYKKAMGNNRSTGILEEIQAIPFRWIVKQIATGKNLV